MIEGILKIIVVALTYPLTKLAELSFYTEYYYAAQCAAMVFVAFLSILFGLTTKSRLLFAYAFVYIVGALTFALMMIPSFAFYCDYLFYESELNFSMIITLADCFIMITGGLNVIYRIYRLCRFGSSSDDIFDARLGLYKWAR